MSKITSPNEHTSNDQKSHGCCGETKAKDQKAVGSQKPQAPASANHEHQDTAKSGGCCGGSKVQK